MKNWDILQRIIKGDLRPHKVNSINELAVVHAIMVSKEPDQELTELIDITYPPPINEKTEIYYWLIRYESEVIKDKIGNLVAEIPEMENLHYKIKSHLVYGIKLKEEANLYRLQLNENTEAILNDENCYIAGCCFEYIDVILNTTLEFYLPFLSAQEVDYFNKKINESRAKKISATFEKIKILAEKRKENATPLFSFNGSNQDELIMKFYTFLKKKKKIDSDSPHFKRHFLQTNENFERIIWKGSVPELKYIFWHLIRKEVINDPKKNLDHLIQLHFLDKNQKPIGYNYLSQALARMRDNNKALHLEKDLDLIFSNLSSN